MKISYLASSYAPFLNGVSFAVHRRVRWLLRRGHEVQLFRPHADSQFPPEVLERAMLSRDELAAFPGFCDFAYPSRPHPFCPTYPVPRSYRCWNVDEHLRKFKPDLILLEDPPSLIGLTSPFFGGYRKFIAADYARETGTATLTLLETDWLKYAVTYFGAITLDFVRPFLRGLVRKRYESYDLNLMFSRDFEERYRRFHAVRTQVLQFHGVETSEFVAANRQFDPIPHDERPVLLFVGRFVPEKSPLEVLDAFAIVRQRFPRAHLVLVGSGRLERKMKLRARPLGDSVSFPGEAHGNVMKGWYARADMLINPTATEAFSTTNMEAMASGTPVVAAASGGNLEQIIEDRNGLFARPHDPADLAARIVELLGDPHRLARLSAECRESIMPLDWNTCCERLERVMLILVAARRQAGSEMARCA